MNTAGIKTFTLYNNTTHLQTEKFTAYTL